MQEALKSALDRIIVKDNARMEQIIDWYIKNQEYLESQPFVMPFRQGLICLQEEQIDFSFEAYSDNDVLIKIYPLQKETVMMAFRYDFVNDVILETRWSKNIPPEKLKYLKMIEQFDKTSKKEAFKYRVLMYYAAYYKNEVVVDKKAEKRMDKHTRNSLKKKGCPIPLIRNTYIFEPDNESLKKPMNPDKKRDYTKPNHEVTVRGYRRKNGTWVEPYTRYKDKTPSGPKTYKV